MPADGLKAATSGFEVGDALGLEVEQPDRETVEVSVTEADEGNRGVARELGRGDAAEQLLGRRQGRCLAEPCLSERRGVGSRRWFLSACRVSLPGAEVDRARNDDPRSSVFASTPPVGPRFRRSRQAP